MSLQLNSPQPSIRTILSRGGVMGIAACPGINTKDATVDISHLIRQIA